MAKDGRGSSVAQRIAAALLGITVLTYGAYHIASLFGEDVRTFPSGVSTNARVLDGKGFVFRDENVLYSSNAGVVDYIAADGAKVSVGDELALVAKSGDASSRGIVRSLDKKIAILEKSVESGKTLADLPEINDNISDSYYALTRLLASSDTGSIAQQKEKLLMNMNCRSLIVEEDSPIDNSLEQMRSIRQSIIDGGGEAVLESTDKSGYFYSYADGFESIFTMSAAENIDAQTFYELTESKPLTLSANAYGKLANSYEWRFVMKVSELEEPLLRVGDTYSVEFVENGNVCVPMTVESESEDTQGGGKIVVLRANRLPEGFSFDRCQSVRIEVSAVSGIYVPRSAIHISGGHYGVYVLKGSVVRYRRLNVIYEAKDYVLCSEHEPEGVTVEYLGVNELVIIGGSNLFDGRILD